MKNAINYFYNIVIENIYQNGKMFYFDYGGYNYALVMYKGEIALLNNIYNLHLEALKNGIYVHQIILNKDNQVATLISGTPYVLMRIFYDKEKITFDKLIPFMNIFLKENFNINRTDWETLWSSKIDYLEYEISQLGSKHPEIRETFSYFIGLGETGIQLVNTVFNEKNVTALKSLCHDRIKSSDSLFDLYNPLNLVVDYRVRDAAEYFKYCFFAGNNIDEELYNFLNYSNLTTAEYLLFLARMLYPTYYFDIYEAIINGEDKKEELKKIINKIDDYEVLLKKIYKLLKRQFPIIPIEWLES